MIKATTLEEKLDALKELARNAQKAKDKFDFPFCINCVKDYEELLKLEKAIPYFRLIAENILRIARRGNLCYIDKIGFYNDAIGIYYRTGDIVRAFGIQAEGAMVNNEEMAKERRRVMREGL